jgi:hypothetical protein
MQKPQYWEKNLHQCNFVHKNPTWTALRLNPALQNDKLEINCPWQIVKVTIFTKQEHKLQAKAALKPYYATIL